MVDFHKITKAVFGDRWTRLHSKVFSVNSPYKSTFRLGRPQRLGVQSLTPWPLPVPQR